MVYLLDFELLDNFVVFNSSDIKQDSEKLKTFVENTFNCKVISMEFGITGRFFTIKIKTDDKLIICHYHHIVSF